MKEYIKIFAIKEKLDNVWKRIQSLPIIDAEYIENDKKLLTLHSVRTMEDSIIFVDMSPWDIIIITVCDKTYTQMIVDEFPKAIELNKNTQNVTGEQLRLRMEEIISEKLLT